MTHDQGRGVRIALVDRGTLPPPSHLSLSLAVSPAPTSKEAERRGKEGGRRKEEDGRRMEEGRQRPGDREVGIETDVRGRIKRRRTDRQKDSDSHWSSRRRQDMSNIRAKKRATINPKVPGAGRETLSGQHLRASRVRACVRAVHRALIKS